MNFKDNVVHSFKTAHADVERLRTDHIRLRNSAHDWIIFLAHENKELLQRIDMLEEKLQRLEHPSNARYY